MMSVEDFLFQDNLYDLESHLSQLEGGDNRLDPYVFLYYNSLGYIIYGISDIGTSICYDIYKYNNYLGLQDQLKIYSKNKPKRPIKYFKKYKNIEIKGFKKGILYLKDKENIKFKDVNINNLY